MDRHHTEYVRKARAIRRRREKRPKQTTPASRRSERSTQASAEVLALKAIIQEKDKEIDELCAMLDKADGEGRKNDDEATPDGETPKDESEDDVIRQFLVADP